MASKQTNTYAVLSPLKHGGQRYAVGSTVELTAADAGRLQALDVIGGLQMAAAPEIPPAERLARISTAIDQLDKDNKELWTKGDKPQVAAIEAIAGFTIAAGERDQAWAAMQGAKE